MSYEPPTPPAEVPTDIVDTLNKTPPDQLRNIAGYAEALAEHKEREARLEEESDEDDVEDQPDDRPDDVPAKATITIKEINDNLACGALIFVHLDEYSSNGTSCPGYRCGTVRAGR